MTVLTKASNLAVTKAEMTEYCSVVMMAAVKEYYSVASKAAMMGCY